MLERMTGLPEGVVALRAVGRITAGDYARVVEPIIEDACATGRRLRLLLALGPEYEGFTADVVAEKTGTLLRHPAMARCLEGYALVSDIRWISELVHLAGFLLPFPMRVFPDAGFDDAVAWLAALPAAPGSVGPHAPVTA
ncbi:hypothetical protein GCM10023200_27370 [Actinomycetospora chlora]|uniref:STAS/SEC14 domain-containing protein n=1 Tax=Actinomycetospora chlora TaxID=663608 RepID=A0ABP9B532_9PSEU